MSVTYAANRPSLRDRLAYQLRVLRVIAGVQFKLKYVDSALGYVWSLAKPLSYFAVLWVVFGRFFDTGVGRFPLYLLLGIVLFTFLVDAVGGALPSIVERAALLRRIAFPPVLIPMSATLTALMTFSVNLVAVAVFIAVSGIVPDVKWLLLLPLLGELYVFIVGLAFVISALFVRFRDIGPIWELVSQLILFASPIMYPITTLPSWAERVEMLNPFVQVLQDVRYIVLGPHVALGTIPTSISNHVIPLAVALLTFLFGIALQRRFGSSFAEAV